LKLDLINSAEGSTALFSLCFKFLVVKAFATVSYNVPSVPDVPVPFGPVTMFA